jgi:acetate---CoA ligase (ADP-forming)
MILQGLLYPRSVAVIGASATPGKVGHAIVSNLLAGAFAGPIYPVNPSRDEILGLKCYPDVRSCPDPVDLVVVVVPTDSVRAAITAALDKRVAAIVTITAGFKEIGAGGAALERDLARLVRERNVPMLGPNCVGLINTHHQMNASFMVRMPARGDITVVSQSGALCASILDVAAGRQLGLAKLISIGNKADLTETEVIEALVDDDHTRVILAYLEDILSGDRFIEAASRVAAVKPLIVLKVGTTAAGARAAASHTGSMVGGDMAYAAAFRRAGVVRADSLEGLFDLATAFSMQPLPQGGRVAVVTNSGGPGIMAADAIEGAALSMATLAPETVAALRDTLSRMAALGNPVDVLGDCTAAQYGAAIQAVSQDSGVDAVIALWTPVAVTPVEDAVAAIAANVHPGKPMLVALMGEEAVRGARIQLLSQRIPDYPSPERAVRALRAMTEYVRWRERPPRVVTRFPVNRRRVERIIARHVRTGQHAIGEVKAKEVLAAYDFQIPEGHLAITADEAVEIAERVGYPVAMKIVSPDILHKSDMGGVKLNLGTPESVRDAFDLMLLRIAKRMPEARLDGAYVEKMAPRAREVIIGMSRDPQFGPMLMFGLGGIFVEVMKDVSFYLAPITADEALQMLKGTRSYALLTGVRGQSGVDLDAIARCLQRISQLVTDFPAISELDINPLLVGPMGTEPVVADARMILSDKGTGR